MKTKTVWISCILAVLFCGRTADATVIIALDQVGSNVVAMGSGTINFTDLTFDDPGSFHPFINPIGGVLALGETSAFAMIFFDLYSGMSGPGSFGSGLFAPPSTSTGSQLFLGAPTLIGLPVDYVSGMPLDSAATWNNTTLVALGVTPKTTFTWTWGSGANADSLTLEIGFAPEPAPALLLSLGAAGLVLLKWRSSMRNRRP